MTDKLVKILLSNGVAINMYADTAVLEKVIYNPKFLKFKDDENDNIYISLKAITGLEVVDDRKKPDTSES